MARRPLSTQAQIGSIVVPIASAVLARVQPMHAALSWSIAIGVPVAWAVWLVFARRRELASPLVVDLSDAAVKHEEANLSLRRIRVLNRGTETVRGVHVQLAECVQQNPTFYPVTLQRMHKAPHPFDLNPDEPAFIDLVALGHGSPELALAYDRTRHPGLPNGVRVQPLDLVVWVSAEDVKRSVHRFSVSVDATNRLHVFQP